MWQVAIPALMSLAGAGLQSEAAQAGAELSAEATDAATEAQQRAFRQAQEMQAPWMQAGYQALAGMEGQPVYGFTPEEQLRLQEQQAGLRRIQAAQGNRQSGIAARQQMGLLEQATADAYNRAYGGQLGRATMGAQAAGLGANLAQQGGQGIASAYLQGAQQQVPYIQAAGQLGASNLAMLGQLGGGIANYYSSQPAAGPIIGGPGLDAYNTSWFGSGEDIV